MTPTSLDPRSANEAGGRGWLRSPLVCTAGGAIIAIGAVLSYFLIVVPLFPDLRDSGVPNVILGAGGAVLALVGLSRGWRRRRRWVHGIFAGFAVASAAFLAWYVLVLSYKLPPAERALDVGRRAPAFALPDTDGRLVSIEKIEAPWKILLFFRGHW